MNEKAKLIEAIRAHEQDIRETQARIKLLKEDLKDYVEAAPESAEVGRLKDALAVAKEDLMNALKRDANVNHLMEEIGAETEVLNSAKFSLSGLLVSYFGQTNEKQVQMDEQGHARDVILSAKLGKDEKSYQESIFSQDRLD